MAILKGDIKFTGKIGGLVGRKVNNKFIISTPGGFSSERLERGRNKQFKKVFQNATEFGMSSRLATGIYNSLKSILGYTYFSDKTYNALMSRIHPLRVFDTQSQKGKRRPTIHTLNQLRNFCFNSRAVSTWKIQPRLVQNPNETPNMSLNNALKDIKWPINADKIRLSAIHMQIDIPNITVTATNAEYIEIDRPDANQPIEWALETIPSNTLTALAVEFYQVINNHSYQLLNRDFKPLHITNFNE